MILVWLYVTDVVLDGNTLKWQNSDQALKMIKIKRYACAQWKACVPVGTPCRRCGHTRRSPVQKVQTPSSLTSRQRSALTWGFLMFGPWYLTCHSWFYGFGPWCRIYFYPGLDPLYWLLMVLSHGVNKGLTINREGDHFANVSLKVEYLKIWILGYQF